jgi:hypothetical protein
LTEPSQLLPDVVAALLLPALASEMAVPASAEIEIEVSLTMSPP